MQKRIKGFTRNISVEEYDTNRFLLRLDNCSYQVEYDEEYDFFIVPDRFKDETRRLAFAVMRWATDN